MNYCPLTTILFLIIVPLIDCSASLDGLRVDTLTLANTNQTQTQIYNHKFQKCFEEPPQLALTLIGFECSKQPMNSSFHIIPRQITPEGFAITWLMNAQKWTKVHVYYLASTRSDIIAGCAHATIPQSSDNTQKQLTLTTTLIPNYDSSIFRTFLLGCDHSSQSIKCGIFPKGLTNSSINVLIQHTGSQGGSITFSYIIFSPSAASFTSYGGFISKQNFNGYLATDLHKSLGYSAYRLQGLSYLQSSNLNSMKSTINDEFVFRMATDTLFDRFAIFYVIIGKSSKILCSNQSQPYQFGNSCLSVCPNNTYPYQYADGGIACRTCSKFLDLTLINGSCVPMTQTQKQQSISYEKRQQMGYSREAHSPEEVRSVSPRQTLGCSENEFILNGNCVCRIGYSRIKGICIANQFSDFEILPIIVDSIRIKNNTFDGKNETIRQITPKACVDTIVNTGSRMKQGDSLDDINSTLRNDKNLGTKNSDVNKLITNCSKQITTNVSVLPSSKISQKQQIRNKTIELPQQKQKSSNLELVGQIKANSNQVFVTLDTLSSFQFADQSQMSRFMKAKFTGCQQPTYYCSQQRLKKNIFDCLIIFPSGIPNKLFKATFSYSGQSKEGRLQTQIDILKIMANSKRKTNAKQGKSSIA